MNSDFSILTLDKHSSVPNTHLVLWWHSYFRGQFNPTGTINKELSVTSDSVVPIPTQQPCYKNNNKYTEMEAMFVVLEIEPRALHMLGEC